VAGGQWPGTLCIAEERFMNAHRWVGLVLIALAPLALAQETELETAKEKVSYGIGLDVGRNLLRGGILKEDLDLALVMQGLKDALAEQKFKITEKEFEEAYQAAIAPKLPERAKAAAAKNKKDSEAFLATNKTKKGVKTTASGLQYRVIKAGTGKTPKATDKVRTTYRGTLIDGTEFDKSEQPFEFPVNGVIKGWTEALQLMKEGDTFELVVPANLAYGEEGFAPSIPPHSTLVFQVELVQVVPGTTVPRNTPKPKGE
jgi:FKBP-type peptidyl-prolyl cis-trans isomerase